MSDVLIGVIIGGCIGILGGMFSTWFRQWSDNRRTTAIVSNTIRAQLEYIKDKARRFKEGNVTIEELRAGKPLYKSLSDNLGFLSLMQAKTASKAVLMYFELLASGRQKKADEVIAACAEALKLF